MGVSVFLPRGGDAAAAKQADACLSDRCDEVRLFFFHGWEMFFERMENVYRTTDRQTR